VFTMAAVSVRELSLLYGSSLRSSARASGWGVTRSLVCVVASANNLVLDATDTRERDRAVTLKDALGNPVRYCCYVARTREVRAQGAAEEQWKWGNWDTRNPRGRILRILVAESLTRVGR
jgi:hypothetical protein